MLRRDLVSTLMMTTSAEKIRKKGKLLETNAMSPKIIRELAKPFSQSKPRLQEAAVGG